MKKCSPKNEELKNVEALIKSQVVGKWFVKVPRTGTVSIILIIYRNHPKKSNLKCMSYQIFIRLVIARVPQFLVQILVKKKDHQVKNFVLFGKISNCWQDLDQNKNFKTMFKFFKNTLISFNSSTISLKKYLRFKTNKELLKCGDIEANPGPMDTGSTGKIITYNVRGIKEYSKLKRILNLCAKVLKSNPLTVINLQETHLDNNDRDRIKLLWRGGFNLSPGTNRSRGCMTLWSSTWNELEVSSDNQGRLCSTTLRKNGFTVSFINIYGPNDHNIQFFDGVFNEAVRLKDKYDDVVFICGDFNLVIDAASDSVSRSQSAQEIVSSELVGENMSALQMFDCYRAFTKVGGYTWNRGICYSRLDMIYASELLDHKIVDAKIDWSFDNSDHAMLEITYLIPNLRKKGPGLPRVDPSILERDHLKTEVMTRLTEQINQIPDSWNADNKWEFIKVSLRSIMWEIAGREKKVISIELESIKTQLNLLKVNKADLIKDGLLTGGLEIDIDNAIKSFEMQLEKNLTLEKVKNLLLEQRLNGSTKARSQINIF